MSFLTITVLKCKFIDSSSHRVFCPSVRYSIFSNATFCLSDYYDHVYFICKKSNCEAIIEYSSACTVYHNYSDTAINVQQWVRQPLCGMCYNIVVNLLLERYIPWAHYLKLHFNRLYVNTYKKIHFTALPWNVNFNASTALQCQFHAIMISFYLNENTVNTIVTHFKQQFK